MEGVSKQNVLTLPHFCLQKKNCQLISQMENILTILYTIYFDSTSPRNYSISQKNHIFAG